MPFSNYIGSSAITQPGVVTSTTRPASPYEGQVIYETDTNRVLVWDNSAWVMPNTNTTNPPGLELITPTSVTNGSISGAAAVPSGSNTSIIVEGVFSDRYAAYKIVCDDILFSSPGGGIYFVLGNNATGANYYQGGFFVNAQTNGATWHSRNSSSEVIIGTQTSGNEWSSSFDVVNPAVAKITSFPVLTGYSEIGGLGVGTGFHNQKTAFTSFVIKGGGTLSGGSIRVYGYKK